MLVSTQNNQSDKRFEAETLVFFVVVGFLLSLRMYFEGLDGGPTQDRVCRGSNENDNFGSYFTVYWTSTLEGCKSQCVEIAECKGRAQVGRFCLFFSLIESKHKKKWCLFVGSFLEKVIT